ncbi:hypothetical protein M413DRAFT_449524 [Hebeloma cylindrosporum]|uniref:Uncharacterized protein n=1 Tax=Hebeloma cylindrosporum TaxID=76867 RepID=A0A0C3BUZ2_HEBCY|nr:hypothetical protein M413DRAFT_449524 [Hebeloma cylindrosporum h7]
MINLPHERPQKLLELGGTYTFELSASRRPADSFYGGTRIPPNSERLDGSADQPSNLFGRFKTWNRSFRRSLHQSLREPECRSLDESSYTSVIILHPKDSTYPLYNLDAKLGERDSHGNFSLKFYCSAASDSHSSFREVQLDVKFSRLGNARTPIKPLAFYPKGTFKPSQILVERTVNVSTSANISASTEGSYLEQYTSAVTFSGQGDESKVTWIWKADDALENGLEDPCEFWVTLPPVETGVKADFTITCQVRGSNKPAKKGRGRNNIRRLTF